MNIGIFTDTYYPQISGVDTSVRMLEKELRKLGHKVFIFTTTDPDAEKKKPFVFRFPSVPFIFLPSRRFSVFYPPKLAIKMKGFKLDVIHTQTEFSVGVFGKLTAKLLKIPNVHTYHTMYVDYVHYIAGGRFFTPNMAQKYSRMFCDGAKAVITTGEKPKESLLAYGVKRPIHVIPNGIDFENFSREKYSKTDISDTKAEIGLDANAPVVVVIGRIAKEKSIEVVVKAMPGVLEKIPNAKLVIVGEGPLLGDLNRLALSLKIQKSVIFTGPRPWSEIGKYYLIGDVFVSASTTETQGLTYIEAMSAKVPVIAKKDKSVESIISHNETGVFFENDEELPGLICDMLENSEKREKIAENANANIAHLSSAQFAKNVEEVYASLVKNYPGKSAKKSKSSGKISGKTSSKTKSKLPNKKTKINSEQ